MIALLEDCHWLIKAQLPGAFQGNLTVRDDMRTLSSAMIFQISYRYYWYYGPLSMRRDGWAMGCRATA